MNRPYDDLPRQGEHHGPGAAHDSSTTVRAPQPPDLSSDETSPAERIHQLAHDQKQGRYRLRAWAEGEVGPPDEGFEETGRYTSGDALTEALGQLPDQPRFVVLENTQTGDVHLSRDSDLGGDWTGDDRFDQVTLFTDEADAAAYAKARQGAAE